MAAEAGTPVGEMLIPFWTPNTRSIDILLFYGIVALALLALKIL